MIERIESSRMVRLFASWARLADAVGAQITFEWPRRRDCWTAPEITALQRTLRHSSAFDGCACGLKDARGHPLKKLWVIFTNGIRVARPASRRCAGGHDHVSC